MLYVTAVFQIIVRDIFIRAKTRRDGGGESLNELNDFFFYFFSSVSGNKITKRGKSQNRKQ